MTLWAASTGAPSQVAQARTGVDGSFTINAAGTIAKDATLYVVARGGRSSADKTTDDNPSIALMTAVGSNPPAKITINEMTTVASVVTHNQWIDGTAIKGSPLALRIATDNVLNFVDLATGGYGMAIQDSLNSSQTPTMANFATLSTIVAGCTTQVVADACARLFAAATSPSGTVPADTLSAAVAIVRSPAYSADRVFALLDVFFPVPKGKKMRATPYMPYLTFAPSAWVLPLKFAGGGRRRHPGPWRLFPQRTSPASQPLLRCDPRSGTLTRLAVMVWVTLLSVREASGTSRSPIQASPASR